MCKKGAERKRRRMAKAELLDSTERAFEAYGTPLETVSTFKYLGRVMTVGDDDWPAVAGNLVKAWKRRWMAKSATAAPSSSVLSLGCLPLPDSCRLPLSSPVPDI